MKKIVLMFCLFVCGCWLPETGSSQTTGDLNCITCRDLLVGAEETNLCNGTSVLWEKVKSFACVENAQCQQECKSLCSNDGIDQNCEACLLLPKSRQDYLNCDMIGKE